MKPNSEQPVVSEFTLKLIEAVRGARWVNFWYEYKHPPVNERLAMEPAAPPDGARLPAQAEPIGPDAVGCSGRCDR